MELSGKYFPVQVWQHIRAWDRETTFVASITSQNAELVNALSHEFEPPRFIR
jgi:hypothetical protein